MASGPGGAGVGATSLGDLALVGGATMEAGGPFPGAEDFAVGSVTVTPVEADEASVEADAASAEVDVASAEADVVSVEADIASVEADMPSVEAGAEAVPMVVGAGRLHPQLEALAADGICCRPLRFGGTYPNSLFSAPGLFRRRCKGASRPLTPSTEKASGRPHSDLPPLCIDAVFSVIS